MSDEASPKMNRAVPITDVTNPRRWNVQNSAANRDKMMILLLYGSWNVRIAATMSEEPKWVSMMKAVHPELKNFASAAVQVDGDEETYELCVNDQSVGGYGAPPELPAIVFLGVPSVYDAEENKMRIEHVQYYGAKLESLLSKGDELSIAWKTLLNHMEEAYARLVNSDGKLRPSPPQPKVTKRIPNNSTSAEPATRIFIAGDRSQVGKSSICMGLLGALLKTGKYKPSDLAYIKPATQCEQTQLVEAFCKHKGIDACVPIGPIVYYKGFTRSFLKGETGENSEQLLQNASEAVDSLAKGKKVVIIDGVGYPAVGSITGTDNASVALACGVPFTMAQSTQRAPVPVLLIGKSGVGDAVDSFNINATYFIHRNIPVVGSIFNKLSLNGFYSLQNCKEAIEMYFHKFQPDKKAFGFIPEIQSLSNARENIANIAQEEHMQQALDAADLFVEEFRKHVNVDDIVLSAKEVTAKYIRDQSDAATSAQLTSLKRPAGEVAGAGEVPTKYPRLASNNGFSLSREQIEAMASAAGAAGG